MLPANPPNLSAEDFDPDATMITEDEEEQERPKIKLSSIEINLIIHQYLLESNFTHTAFSLLHESKLQETELYKHFNPRSPVPPKLAKANGFGKNSELPTFGDLNGRLPPGQLVNKLWKSVRWEEIERHTGDGGYPKETCPNPFHLVRPHRCPSTLTSAQKNADKPFPTFHMSPPTSLPEIPSDGEDEQPVAGPSTKRKADTEPKRKSRRTSDASTIPSRSPSPASRKRRALTNDEDDFVDAGEKVKAAAGRRRKGAGRDNDTKEQLQIPPSSTPVRGTSPTKQDQSELLVSALKLGEGNPKWFKSSEVGLFTEHKDIVNAVAWSPGNDDLLASASNDTSARIWELRKSDKPDTNRLELASTDSNPAHLVHKTVQTGKNPVTCLTWNAAGTILATGAKEGSAMTFTASGSFLYVLTQGTNLAINTIKFSPSGRYLMSGSKSSEVRINEISGDGERHKGIYKGQTDEVNDVDWLDDNVFATAGNDHKICIYHSDNRQRPRYILKGHTDDVLSIKWSPPHLPNSQRYLASIADDGQLLVWGLPEYPEAFDKKSTASTGTGAGGGSASPFKREREGSGSGDDYQFDATPKHLVCKWQVVDESESENQRMCTNALGWSQDQVDGKVLLAAGGQDSTIKIFDLTSKSLVHTLSGFEEGTGCLAFSPPKFRGAMGAIAGGSWNASFKVWDVETGEVLKEFGLEEDDTKRQKRDRPFVTSIAWRHDGEHIAVGLHNKAIMTFYVGDLKRTPEPNPSVENGEKGEVEAKLENGTGNGDGDVQME